MNVLHIAAGKMYGGLETVLVTLARYREASSDVNHEFAVCFDGRLGNELRETGAKVHVLGAARVSRPWQIALVNWRLQRVIRQRSVDVVVVHGAWTHVVCASAALTVPVVHWCHGAPMEPNALDRLAERFRPQLVVVSSRHTERALGDLFSAVKRAVVYNPLGAPPPSTRSREEIRAEFDTQADALVIACASRLERRKGHVLLLNSLASLNDIPNWVLWVIGGAQNEEEKAYFRELEALASTTGLSSRVRFLGQRSDVRTLLTAADLFCQPNIDPDAFGISYVEALYAGVPVVTSAMGGALEVVDDTCGVLTQPNQTELATVLRRLLTDSNELKRLGQAGPARAKLLCDPIGRVRELTAALRPLVPRETLTAAVAGE